MTLEQQIGRRKAATHNQRNKSMKKITIGLIASLAASAATAGTSEVGRSIAAPASDVTAMGASFVSKPVLVGGGVVPKSACETNGTLAENGDGSGHVLHCVEHKWQALAWSERDSKPDRCLLEGKTYYPGDVALTSKGKRLTCNYVLLTDPSADGGLARAAWTF